MRIRFFACPILAVLLLPSCGQSPSASTAETPASTFSRAEVSSIAPDALLPADNDAACIDALSQGTNQFKVKVSKPALVAFSGGLARFGKQLKDARQGLLIDYSMNSKLRRAFFVDFKTCSILANEYVIHGGAVYKPEEHYWGDPQQDGLLKTCHRPDGSTNSMTRPGFFLTAGCHMTTEEHWTKVFGNCDGIKLQGLEKSNADAFSRDIVLHEHEAVPNDNSVKLMGQGCPAFPPGRLKGMVRFGITEGTLVFLYAPQCHQ